MLRKKSRSKQGNQQIPPDDLTGFIEEAHAICVSIERNTNRTRWALHCFPELTQILFLERVRFMIGEIDRPVRRRVADM